MHKLTIENHKACAVFVTSACMYYCNTILSLNIDCVQYITAMARSTVLLQKFFHTSWNHIVEKSNILLCNWHSPNLLSHLMHLNSSSSKLLQLHDAT